MSPKPHVRDSHGAVGGTALCPGAATAAVPVRSSSWGPPCPLCGAGGYSRATGDGSMAAAALVWFSSLAGPVRCCGVSLSVGSAGLAALPGRGRAAVTKRLKRGLWAADTYRGLPRGLGRAGLLHHRPATASAGTRCWELGLARFSGCGPRRRAVPETAGEQRPWVSSRWFQECSEQGVSNSNFLLFYQFLVFPTSGVDAVPWSCLGSSRLPPQDLCVETAVSVVIETLNLNETMHFSLTSFCQTA